jgi:hypothetical protein
LGAAASLAEPGEPTVERAASLLALSSLLQRACSSATLRREACALLTRPLTRLGGEAINEGDGGGGGEAAAAPGPAQQLGLEQGVAPAAAAGWQGTITGSGPPAKQQRLTQAQQPCRGSDGVAAALGRAARCFEARLEAAGPAYARCGVAAAKGDEVGWSAAGLRQLLRSGAVHVVPGLAVFCCP